MTHGLIPYIGGKHRLAKRLVEFCRCQERDLFIDVFGGSAAVMLAASSHFPKLVYNDADAQQLADVKSHVVCTYYRTPLIEELYPAERWIWTSISATKNCCLTRGNKVVTDEWVISKICLEN